MEAPVTRKSQKNLSHVTEEDTKSTSNEQSIYTSEVLNESFLGSTSEGSDSMLAQKIPAPAPLPATQLPSRSEAPLNKALWEAVTQNKPELCKELLDRAVNPDVADVNSKGLHDCTALHIASGKGFLEVCEVLLDYGDHTDVNSRNALLRTPLHVACEQGHLDIAQLLVRSGAELNSLDIDGNTPLHLIVAGKSVKLLRWFLGRGPDLRVRNHEGLNALDISEEDPKTLLSEYIQRNNIDLSSLDLRASFDHRVRIGELRGQEARGICADNFDVLEELGKGSFGEVYLVRKKDTSMLYAMKVLKKEKIMGQNLIKYALTERNVLSYLKHPFIVSLNFAFQTTDKLFLILDFCSGGDLSSHLSREKRFHEYRARIYICEIILALEELHRRDIIFRDLKPDNIVIDKDGHAMLTDFGLSKEGVFDNYMARSFCGSLAYLAPEMIRRRGHGKAVDWYLLGVVLYEMLVGIPPYFSPNREELLQNIQRGKLMIPSSLSLETKDLLKQLLQRDPALRLGAKRDAEEVKQHRFFAGINWESVLRRELKPPAPEPRSVPEQSIPGHHIFGEADSGDEGNRVTGWTFISSI